MITVEELRRTVDYDPATGVLRWILKNRRGVCAGRPAKPSTNPIQGTRIRINRVLYYAHRLAWLYVHGVWPTGVVDHINGDRNDNRIENLRDCTQGQNLANSKKRKSNTSGFKGVAKVWNGSWRATVKGRHVGTFQTVEAARDAYRDAAKQVFGQYARFE
jgi:hypothetical protein